MAKSSARDDEQHEGPRSRTRRILSEALGIGVVLLLAVSARSSLADHYHVPSGSMLPTIELKDRILVNKMAFGLRIPLTNITLAKLDEPSPGDVVVLESPTEGDVLLKRIVAVPGDRVEIRRGRIVRNGELAPLQWRDGMGYEQLGEIEHPVSFFHGGGPDLPTMHVPAEHYLVVGDNRGNSLDGRVFGLVRRDALLGRSLGVYARGGRPSWHPL